MSSVMNKLVFGVSDQWDSNRPAQLQWPARVLKFWLQQVEALYYPGSENKGADQTAQMRRLTCAFVVRIWHKQVFSWCGSNGSITTVWNVQWNTASTMLQTDINVEWLWHWILFWRFIKRPLSHVSMAFQSYQRWRIKAFEQKQSEPRQANLCLRAFRHNKFQLRMPSHSAGPGIWLSVWRFLLIHCLYERAAKVLARLRGCAGSPEPSLLA